MTNRPLATDRILTGLMAFGLLLGLTLTGAGSAAARDPAQPGHFDYYLLSLSWSPEFCASPSGNNAPDQCAPSRRYGFVLHGLWPQYASGGYPEACTSSNFKGVSEALINRMLPIMPARGLIRHEWDKHGTCTGLTADAYFDQAAKAYRSIRIPEAYQQPAVDLPVALTQVRAGFQAANPGLDGNALSVICKKQYLTEVRICLSPALVPTPCGPDIRNQCRGDKVVLRAVRSGHP